METTQNYFCLTIESLSFLPEMKKKFINVNFCVSRKTQGKNHKTTDGLFEFAYTNNTIESHGQLVLKVAKCGAIIHRKSVIQDEKYSTLSWCKLSKTHLKM